MSIRIYSTEYTSPLSAEILETLLASLPRDIAAKARRYRRWQDAYACVFGKLLLMVALKELGLTADLSQLRYTDYGRPFLLNAPDFNISHSGHRVVCVTAANGRVGIDLEAIGDLDIQDFKTQFSPAEWQAITGAEVPLQTFYHFWTAKECLSKADGRGLNLPLAGLKIADAGPVRVEDRWWYLSSLTEFAGYACHVAAESPMDEVFMKEINLKELSVSILGKHRNYPT